MLRVEKRCKCLCHEDEDIDCWTHTRLLIEDSMMDMCKKCNHILPSWKSVEKDKLRMKQIRKEFNRVIKPS
jgi:hypothetical protein